MNIGVSVVLANPEQRRAVAVLIQGTPGFRCTGQHSTGTEALRCIPSEEPDVVLLEPGLTKISGIECVARLKAGKPKFQFLMLVELEQEEAILDALSAGATGCLLKDTPPGEIVEALRDIHQGGSPMSSVVARKVIGWFQQARPRLTLRQPLTEREMEVLKLLATGSQDQHIAKSLAISIFTVRSHVRSIFDKLDVHSRTEAVVKFLGRTSVPEKQPC